MKRIFILSLMAAAFMAGGCSDFLDVNDNPNAAVSTTPELVLANALNVTGQRWNHHEIGAYWSGQWCPGGSFSGFVPERTYNITTTFRTGIWTGGYDNLTDFKVVEESALANGKIAIAGIARVMKAFNYQIIVDAYGNAPYTEALRGTSLLTPAYDTDEVIYDSLLLDLDKGIERLSVPISSVNPSPANADIVFGGDTEKWIKFANTLKLRLLIRMSNARDVSANVAALVTSVGANGFLGAGEDVTSDPGYIKSNGKMNAFYENFGYTAADSRAALHDAYAVNDDIVVALQQRNDPRLSRIAYPSTATNIYRGVPLGAQGLDWVYAQNSGIGPAVLPNDAGASTGTLWARPQMLMTAAESYFLQAEAVQRGMYSGTLTAQQLYEKGIEESFRLNGVPDPATEAANYALTPLVDFTSGSNDKLELILTQKWIALMNYCGFEAWCEFRRTGVPAVTLSVQAAGSHPVRLLYPQSEYSNNSVNALAQGNISQYTSRIFWDVD